MAETSKFIVRHYVTDGRGRHIVNGWSGDSRFNRDDGITNSIHEAMRNYITKGWETEILAVYHKPEGMADTDFNSLSTRAHGRWCYHEAYLNGEERSEHEHERLARKRAED